MNTYENWDQIIQRALAGNEEDGKYYYDEEIIEKFANKVKDARENFPITENGGRKWELLDLKEVKE